MEEHIWIFQLLWMVVPACRSEESLLVVHRHQALAWCCCFVIWGVRGKEPLPTHIPAVPQFSWQLLLLLSSAVSPWWVGGLFFWVCTGWKIDSTGEDVSVGHSQSSSGPYQVMARLPSARQTGFVCVVCLCTTANNIRTHVLYFFSWIWPSNILI